MQLITDQVGGFYEVTVVTDRKKTTGSCSEVKIDTHEGKYNTALCHLQFPLTDSINRQTLVCSEISWAEVNTPDIMGTYGIRLSLPPDLTPSLFWT